MFNIFGRANGPTSSASESKVRIGSFLRTLTLVLVTATSTLSQTAALSDCKTGKSGPKSGFWTWSSGSLLKIYVMQQDFTAEEIPFLLKPLAQWDAVSRETGTGVRLSYAGTTSRMLDCDNCLTIMRHPVFNRKTRHASEVKAYGLVGTKIIKYAAIYIDPRITGRETLTNAVAHEIGHSFGLLDCYDCREGTTVMNKLKSMSGSNGMEGPTACDIAGVRTAYLELNARLTSEQKSITPTEDEGEEPTEDDTPVVVPTPSRWK